MTFLHSLDPKLTLALPKAVECWFLNTRREKLIKIGAKAVRHGRYITFQLAEVAIPRPLFAEILRLIDGLCACMLWRSGGPTQYIVPGSNGQDSPLRDMIHAPSANCTPNSQGAFRSTVGPSR